MAKSGRKQEPKAQKGRIGIMETAIITAILVVVVMFAMYRFTPTTGSALSPTGGVIQPAQYVDSLASTAHTLIDVRTPQEFAGGHLKGALNIPVDELSQYLSRVPRDMPVVVYCRSGNRSAVASRILRDAGYSTVYDLGGIIAWQSAGYPIE
jgi:rhodanese-related sulfurtransferase